MQTTIACNKIRLGGKKATPGQTPAHRAVSRSSLAGLRFTPERLSFSMCGCEKRYNQTEKVIAKGGNRDQEALRVENKR